MKSVNGINWKINKVPERLILRNKQIFNISYLLSKVFLDKNYSDQEINNAMNNFNETDLKYKNKDFEYGSIIIEECLKNNGKILIFGDYDVDGYSSTYLLYDYFTNLKINCDYYIPDRIIDGYGPNISLLKRLISRKKYSLIIFVDCGSNSFDEINYLEKAGINILIIDHHQIHEHKKFKKTIIINPLKNPLLDKYKYFCATTLVFFFILFLSDKLKIKINNVKSKYLFFAAIATICDQMPLRNINKKIVKIGLGNFNLSKFKNLSKIINTKKKIRSTDISFSLGPIINSAGRLGHSNLPLSLLVEKKNENIEKISKKLIVLNEKRKINQTEIFNLLQIKLNEKKSGIIFMFKRNINPGLMGIIAANFVELYNKPSFILTNSGNFIKCSSRSIFGFDIGKIFYLALKKKIIVNGGGHSMAGGCTLKKDNLNVFENFLKNNFNSMFKNFDNIRYYTSEQNPVSLLNFSKNEFKFLEPLGHDNINPFFLVKNNTVIKFKIINNKHLNLIVRNKYKKSCICFAFNVIGSKLGNILMNSKNKIDLIVQINNRIIEKNSDFNLIIKDAIA